MAKATSRRVAVREVRVAVGNVGFEDMVKILREVWKVPGVGGCDPCRSGSCSISACLTSHIRIYERRPHQGQSAG